MKRQRQTLQRPFASPLWETLVFATTTLLLPISAALETTEGASHNTRHLQNKPLSNFESTQITDNGFDNGGDDPLCFLSVSKQEHLTVLGRRAAQLLPSCDSSVEFTFGNWMVSDADVLSGESRWWSTNTFWNLDYTMDFNFEVTSGAIDSNILELAHEEVYFRLWFCDISKGSVCNPLRLTQNSTLTWEDETGRSVDEEALYQVGDILPAIKYKANGLALFTPWAKVPLETIEGSVGDVTDHRALARVLYRIPPLGTVSDGPRTYMVLGQAAVRFRTPVTGDNTIIRMDTVQILENNLVIRGAPEILTVEIGTQVTVGFLIALAAVFATYCLVVIVQHRKHAVMMLAQGNFLAALTGVCLFQIVWSFWLFPTRDLNCVLASPVLIISTTLIAAIVVGRIWRIYSTLSKASALGRSTKQPLVEVLLVGGLDGLGMLESVVSALCCFCCKKGKRSSSNTADKPKRPRQSFRRAVTAAETASVIFCLTLPQVILQIVGWILYPDQVVTELNDRESLGRRVCAGQPMPFQVASVVYAGIIFIIAVVMAWLARDLPSALNEKDQVFHSASIGTLICVLSIALGRIWNNPTTTPDIVVLLLAAIPYGVAVIVLVSLVYPKVARVRSGEEVVVSKLLGSNFSPTASEQTTSSAEPDKANQTRVHPGEPLPKHVEAKMFEVQSLLKRTLNRSADGRSVSVDQWSEVQTEIGRLNNILEAVEFVETSLSDGFHA